MEEVGLARDPFVSLATLQEFIYEYLPTLYHDGDDEALWMYLLTVDDTTLQIHHKESRTIRLSRDLQPELDKNEWVIGTLSLKQFATSFLSYDNDSSPLDESLRLLLLFWVILL